MWFWVLLEWIGYVALAGVVLSAAAIVGSIVLVLLTIGHKK